ncbi:hypothetical protein [Allonocardiopsis opalescens]|uniref:Uncharacterized protein n=1 Tax=Allonocardiopsis opalescens TaxID=1144618 RepID=A0A2T0PVW5_9ACTN|nr:hypothetical protein [Allonocardiopsis opalescens]PRX95570.1 hypothetical protein CLV72_109179 [Allonocardiopsis opalescens]
MAEKKPYPVYVSPDGTREQIVGSKEREVQLRFQGWTPKPPEPAPRRSTTSTTPTAADKK